jgi:hypothetical protein
MRVLLTVDIPHEPFNTLVRKGAAGQAIGRILETIKPEAVYFLENEGHRCGIFVIDVPSPSDIPRYAEPFFLTFNADCRFRIAMTPDDLKRAGLEDLGKKWS